MGEMWRADYETPDFEAYCQRLFAEVQPLYLRLHNYVLTKLREVYPQIPAGNSIPAHILGNFPDVLSERVHSRVTLQGTCGRSPGRTYTS